MARVIIGNILRIIGYVVFFSALGGAAQGDFVELLALYGISTFFFVCGANIHNSTQWKKPTFTTDAGGCLGWIFYILFIPFVNLFFDAWRLFKFIITLPFRFFKRSKHNGGSKGSSSTSASGSIRASSSAAYGNSRSKGGEKVFDRAVGRICYQHRVIGSALPPTLNIPFLTPFFLTPSP